MTAVIFLERKQLQCKGCGEAELSVWYWMRCVWLMLPVGWSSQNSRPSPISSCSHLSCLIFSPLLFFQPFMLTPPLSESLSHVSLQEISDGALLWSRSNSPRLCHHECQPWLSDTKLSLEVTGPVVWVKIGVPAVSSGYIWEEKREGSAWRWCGQQHFCIF